MKRTNRSRAPARRPSTQRRPVSTGSGMGAKLLIMAAVVAAVVFGVAIFFKVGRVEVQGNTIYSSEKIMEASGLELGDNLLTVSRARVAGNVKAALPYVDQVSVGRVLPDTVVISVKESQLVFAAQTDTNTVWLISPSGKALERIDTSMQEEYPQIIGVTLNNPTAGQEYDMVVQYDDRYEIDLGSSDRLAYKVQYLQAILEQLSDFQAGTIDLTLSEANRAKFHPKA